MTATLSGCGAPIVDRRCTACGRPALLDAFCCAGGAGMGYHRAGFCVTGVDIDPQPNYPFPLGFVQGDAVTFIREHGAAFAAIHTSPPCDAWTKMAGQHRTRDNHPRLIEPTRHALTEIGVPYVIENVEQARKDLVAPVMLCGTMFDLGVFRHRLFETSYLFTPPVHLMPHVGRVGDGRYVTMVGNTGGRSRRDGIRHGNKVDWQCASGVDWMTVAEMRECIPPAYAEFVGTALMAHVTERIPA